MIRAFPDLFAPLFVYIACIFSSEVHEATYIDERVTEVQPGDLIIMAHLKRWVNETTNECKSQQWNFIITIVHCLFPCVIHTGLKKF